MGKVRLNSLFTWYPLVEGVVPTPKTVMIPLEGDFNSLDEALSGKKTKDPVMRKLIDSAIRAVDVVGGYPAFVKGDESAHKHSWLKSCHVTNKRYMESHIKNLMEFTFMVDIGFDGVAVREFLHLDYKFHAFNGMPVAREFRFFIKDGAVQCYHPYWFPSCMERPDCEDWLPKLRETQRIDESEVKLLSDYSVKISDAVKSLGAEDNCWSLDYCIDRKGVWYLTDMAFGPDSYHYSSCKFAPERMRQRYPDPEEMPKRSSLMDFWSKKE